MSRRDHHLALILLAVFMIGCKSDQAPRETSKPLTAKREKTGLACSQVSEARKQFKVTVLSYDTSQEYGIERPYSDYVRLRIANNSKVTLPYLTVLTKRYNGRGEFVGSSRAPSIRVSNIKPGESFESDYYPRGHLPYVKKITVEIEHVISDEDMQFFKELEGISP